MHELETARLHLRPLTFDDLQTHHHVIGSDPQVTWHGKVLTLEESQAALTKRIRHWEEHGFGMWAVIDKAQRSLLGHAGLQLLENTNEVELGYYLGRPAWGKGMATETGAACVRYGFETLGLQQIAAVVRPENRASQHVLSKLGFHYVQHGHYYGFNVQYWRIEREQFQPSDAFYRLVS